MGKEGEASAESMSTAPASRFPLDAQVLYIVVRLCFHEGGKKETSLATDTAKNTARLQL